MVKDISDPCPKCGGRLTVYDWTSRIRRIENGGKIFVRVRRLRCKGCGAVHNLLPEGSVPYKQYAQEVIEGVRRGEISQDILEYEDYPSEATLRRWRSTHFDFGE